MVAVGDSAGVELIFNSGRRKAGFNKRATITCNDHSRGNFQISFIGTIYNDIDSLFPLTLSESSLAFTPEIKNKELKIKIKNVSDEKVRIRLVDYPHGILNINYSKKDIKPGKTKDIKVKIDKSFIKDTFKKSLTFEVNDSIHTRYTIPVTLQRQIAKGHPAKRDTVRAAPIKQKTKSD